MHTEKIGFIGLGNMGRPMAKNLEKAGFNLSVYNRTVEKAKDFTEKTSICGSIADLVAQSSVIFTMLTNDSSVKAVYDQIVGLDISGKLFVDMSTISQKLSQETAQALQNKQASFIDAPVAGSTKPAAEGTLIILVGGEEKSLERALPYLEKMGKLVKHLGGNGQGLAAKLAINYYLSIIYLGLAETMLFAEKMGIDRADMLQIINESASGSGASRVKTPVLTDNDFRPAFALDLMLKDILLAREAGANYPLSEVIAQTYQAAHDNGMGQEDVMAVIKQIGM